MVLGPDSKACFYSFCVVFPRKRLYDVCVQAHVGRAIDWLTLVPSVSVVSIKLFAQNSSEGGIDLQIFCSKSEFRAPFPN